MDAQTYMYANHRPEDRLKVRVIGDDTGSWLLVTPEGENERALQLGLTPTQARELAYALFRQSAEAEAMDADAASLALAPEAAP